MTIDQLIRKLQTLREESNLKGEAVVHICIQEVPYVPLVDVKVENDESGGSVILLMPHEENCKKCGSDIKDGLCCDQTCPYSDRPQSATYIEG